MPDFNFKGGNFPMAEVISAAQRKVQLEEQAKQQNSENFIQGINAIGQVGQTLVAKRLKVAQALALGKQFGMDENIAKQMDPEQILKVQALNKGMVDIADLKDAMRAIAGRGIPKPEDGAEPASLKKPGISSSPTVPPNGAMLTGGLQPVPVQEPMAQAMPMPAAPPGSPVPIAAPPSRPRMVNAATAKLGMDVAKANALEPVITQADALAEGGVKHGTHIIGPKREPLGLSEDRATIGVIDKFNSNPQVRRQQQSIDGATAVRELALSGNPIAASAIPTYMARASGEVGALSEPDKAPFGGSRAILARMEASLKQLATGQLTDDNKKFLIELSDVMEKNAENNLDRKGREFSRQYSSVIKTTPEALFQSMRPGRTFEERKEKAQQVSSDVLTVGGTFNGQRITGVKLKSQ